MVLFVVVLEFSGTKLVGVKMEISRWTDPTLTRVSSNATQLTHMDPYLT